MNLNYLSRETLIKYDSVIAIAAALLGLAMTGAKQSHNRSKSAAYGSPRPFGARDDGLIQRFPRSTAAIAILLLAIGLTPSAKADTVYTYTGNHFSYVGTGPDVTKVSGSFTVSSALAANTTYKLTPATVGGTITSYSFTDGRTLWNIGNYVGNPPAYNTYPPLFTVSTNANGNIVSWALNIFSPVGLITTCTADLGISCGNPGRAYDDTNVFNNYDAYAYTSGTWASSATVSPSDCIFNWAEQHYAQYFSPPATTDATLPPYSFRYYSGTGNYLAISSADNHLYVLGPSFGGYVLPVDVGPVTSFLGVSGCPSSAPPSAPTNVTATAGNGQATITWSSVSGATSYNLYCAAGTSVTTTTGTKIASVASPYTHTGLVNGTTYTCIVTAVNNSGEGPASSPVSSTPMASPTPSSLSYAITSHEASGNCTLYGDQVINGVLTPTGQANVYTTLFISNTAITLTVPGSNAFVFSFQDGSGTSTDNTQLTFDLQSHSISGSDNWTHTDGCMGLITFSGSWTGGNAYSIPVSVTGSTSNVSNVQVCATVSGNATCGPNGGFVVGQSSTLSVTATSGSSYVINVPTNQPAASFCSVTSGGSGILSSSIPTAVVTCQ